MSPLTPNQMERRRRVITAALKLAEEGGYDAVQMRDVSARANVALGTIYRYFSSKDHLLAVVLADWLGELESRFVHEPGQGETAADQICDVFQHSARAVARHPRLMAALIAAISSTDPGVAAASVQVQARLRGMVEGALSKFDPVIREGIISNIQHVWYSTMMQWVIGRLEMSDVADEVERMVRLVVTPYEQGTAARLRKDRVRVAGAHAS